MAKPNIYRIEINREQDNDEITIYFTDGSEKTVDFSVNSKGLTIACSDDHGIAEKSGCFLTQNAHKTLRIK